MERVFKPGLKVKGISGADNGKIGTIKRGTEWIEFSGKTKKPSTSTPTWWVCWDGEKEMKPMSEDDLEIVTR